MPIKRLEGKETLVSTSEEDKGKRLEFEGKYYYVVKDNEDFKNEILFNNISMIITTYITDLSYFSDHIKDIREKITFNEHMNSWDVSNVRNMTSMFEGCSCFNQPLNDWDVSNVVNMSSMFKGCACFNQPLNSWNVSNVKDMHSMFYACCSFNQPLGAWNVSNVKTMFSMFYGCSSFNQSLYTWNISALENMNYIFYKCSKFNQPLDNWDVSNVGSMFMSFFECSSFNQPLNSWNVSNVSSLFGVFSGCSRFNQPLDQWDVSNVSIMNSLFNGCISFNQPLNSWDVSNVKDMIYMFKNCSSFNQPLDKWDVSNVESMSSMFEKCPSFNQSLNSWNVSHVKDTSHMFCECLSLHHSLEQWDISNVKYKNEMFKECPLREKQQLRISCGKVEKEEYHEGCISSDDEEKDNNEKECIQPVQPKERKFIDKKIVDLSSLLEIIKEYPYDPNVEYNIHLKQLHNIKGELQELNSMIGMYDLKISIMNQIIYYLQDLHIDSKGDYMHTCIYGKAGTGKTEVARIIGSIYSKLGILKKGTFKKATRADFVAEYLGQTAIKTRKLFKQCIGGVLFIDEAYSLGNEEKKDIYSKECMDTLCELLSYHKHEIMVIIAGYKDELNKCFFAYNSGLKSRFTWSFDIQEYNDKELMEIFKHIVQANKWSIIVDDDVLLSWFSSHYTSFPYYGRDMEDLFSKVKIVHGRRVFCSNDPRMKKKINREDLEEGYSLFMKYNTQRELSNKEKYPSMYM